MDNTRQTNIIKDYADEKLIFHKQQDVTAILEANTQEFNQTGNLPDLSFGRKVASVPVDILDAWIQEGIDYRLISKDPVMRKLFFAKLNDPEWRKLKTNSGHIG